jgi:hypothetical protein
VISNDYCLTYDSDKIILNNIKIDLKRNRVGRCGLNSSQSGLGPMVGSCEYGNEKVGSIKGGKFLD